MSGTLVLATRSAGKLRELGPMLRDAGWTPVTLAELGVEETAEEDRLEEFETFEENALAKARYFARITGRPTLADDSGLAVDALGGRPGVRSKRWANRSDLSGQALDDENNRLLLELLRAPLESGLNRRARYVCAAAYVDGERELVRLGEVEGYIADEPAGEHGFGYDPYFVSAELGVTFGVATLEQKAGVSHRARAVAAVLRALRA